jgi:hypothetical protein
VGSGLAERAGAAYGPLFGVWRCQSNHAAARYFNFSAEDPWQLDPTVMHGLISVHGALSAMRDPAERLLCDRHYGFPACCADCRDRGRPGETAA